MVRDIPLDTDRNGQNTEKIMILLSYFYNKSSGLIPLSSQLSYIFLQFADLLSLKKMCTCITCYLFNSECFKDLTYKPIHLVWFIAKINTGSVMCYCSFKSFQIRVSGGIIFFLPSVSYFLIHYYCVDIIYHFWARGWSGGQLHNGWMIMYERISPTAPLASWLSCTS